MMAENTENPFQDQNKGNRDESLIQDSQDSNKMAENADNLSHDSKWREKRRGSNPGFSGKQNDGGKHRISVL